MNYVQVIATVLWVLILPFLFSMVLFYRHRFLHPIKERFPTAAMVEMSAAFLAATNAWASLVFEANCTADIIITYFATSIFLTAFNYRLVQLLFAHEITRNIAELQDKKNLKDWKPNWFTSHRELAQPRFNFKVITILYIILTLLVIIFLITAPSHDVCQSGLLNYALTMKGVMGSLFSFTLAFKLWKFPKDAFGIKSEFKWSVITPVIVMIVSAIIDASNEKYSYVTTLALIFVVSPVMFLAITYPYLKSRDQVIQTDDMEVLKTWLSRPEGIKFFLEYLNTEFSSENLIFWLEVEHYKGLLLSDAYGIKEQASQIYQKFIDRISPCALNLPFAITENTTNAVQQLLSPTTELKPEVFTIFDQAQDEIYRLMASDSFPRFRRTSTFEQFKGSLAGKPPKSKGSKSELDQLLIRADSPSPDKVSGLRDVGKEEDREPSLGHSQSGILTYPSSPSMPLRMFDLENTGQIQPSTPSVPLEAGFDLENTGDGQRNSK